MENIEAIILAAGLGTRMKTTMPKVLHKVGGKSLLKRVVDGLSSAGIKDITAVVGYKSNLIEEKFQGKIKFAYQTELLGSGDAVSKGIKDLKPGDGYVLVTCGDAPLISNKTFFDLVDVSLGQNASCVLLTSTVKDPISYGRIIRNNVGDITGIIEEKDATESQKEIKEINVGTYCFRKNDLLENIKNIKLNEKKKEFYLTDIIDILKGKNKMVLTVSCGESEIIGVNTRKELAIVNKILNKKKLDKLMEDGVTIVDPDTTFVNEDVEISADTIIYPNTVIEEDVKIGSNCSIGPFARLRPGSRIGENVEIGNFVEICRSKINNNSKVKHHTYLGDTEVGENVNIGAGTITANYDGKDKHCTVIEDDVFIGVGTVLIAPIKVGAGAKVGAGSVVTKNKDVLPGSIVAGVPARPFSPGKIKQLGE